MNPRWCPKCSSNEIYKLSVPGGDATHGCAACGWEGIVTEKNKSASQEPAGKWVIDVLNPRPKASKGTVGPGLILHYVRGALAEEIDYNKIVVSWKPICSCVPDEGEPHEGCKGDVKTYEDGFTRGMCDHCSSIRCDLPVED